MKRLPKPANLSQKKATKRICDGFNWELSTLIWEKEEPRSKTKKQ